MHFYFRTPTRKHAMLEKLIVNRNLETLLGTIFQPQNAHCIHIDPKVCQDFQLKIWWWTIVPITYFNSKADPVFLKTVEQLISCYRYSNTSTNIQGTVREIEIHGDSPLQCIVTEEKYSICWFVSEAPSLSSLYGSSQCRCGNRIYCKRSST